MGIKGKRMKQKNIEEVEKIKELRRVKVIHVLGHQLISIATRNLLEDHVNWCSLTFLVDNHKNGYQSNNQETKDTSDDADGGER